MTQCILLRHNETNANHRHVNILCPAGPAAEKHVSPEHRGTYLGVIDRLSDIKASGATAILLGSVFLSSSVTLKAAAEAGEGGVNGTAAKGVGGGAAAMNSQDGSSSIRRPLTYMAPEIGFVAGDDLTAAARQLKALIKAVHEQGIEVFLEVRV